MTKQISTSMRLLLSCGSEDIYCSASDSSLNIPSQDEAAQQCHAALNMADETLHKNKSTKQHESNCHMHQLHSSRYKSDCALEEDETAVLSHDEPATKRDSHKEVVGILSLKIETPSRNRGRRQERRCSVTKFNLRDESNTEESERSEKSLCAALLTCPRDVEEEQTNERQLSGPLSRSTSSRRLRPSLQRMWVSEANIQVEGRPTIKESKQQDRQEDKCKKICKEDPRHLSILDRSAPVEEEPESRTKRFHFSQLKTRSLRAISRPQLQPACYSFRKLRGIDDQKKHSNKESDTSSEQNACPRALLTRPRKHESLVQETYPKRNWPGIGLRREAYVISKKLAPEQEENTKSDNEPTTSHQPFLVRSSGNDGPKLQHRNSITKFNLDQATNESFRRRQLKMERRCAVTQFSLGVRTAQAETTSTTTNCCCTCVVVAPPQMSQPKLPQSGLGATVLIFSTESLDRATDELIHNGLAPNAAWATLSHPSIHPSANQ